MKENAGLHQVLAPLAQRCCTFVYPWYTSGTQALCNMHWTAFSQWQQHCSGHSRSIFSLINHLLSY